MIAFQFLNNRKNQSKKKSDAEKSTGLYKDYIGKPYTFSPMAAATAAERRL